MPACGREYYVFAAGNDEQEAIGFDGGLFEIICEDFIRVNIDQTPYNQLPVFLRQYNESAGWNTFLEDEVKINGDELLQALGELSRATLAEWLMKDCKKYCDTLSAFITAQTKNNQDLFLLKT